MLNGKFQYGDDVAVKILSTGFGNAIRAGARVNAGGKERFVCVNVSDATDERLIEQQGLDVAGVTF